MSAAGGTPRSRTFNSTAAEFCVLAPNDARTGILYERVVSGDNHPLLRG